MIHPTMQTQDDNAVYKEIKLAISKVETQLGPNDIVEVKRQYIFDIKNKSVYLMFNNKCVDLTLVDRTFLNNSDIDALDKLYHYTVHGADIYKNLKKSIDDKRLIITSLQHQLSNYGISRSQKDFNLELKLTESLRAKAVYYQIKSLNPDDFDQLAKLFRRKEKPDVVFLVTKIHELSVKMLEEVYPTDYYVAFKPVIELVLNTACWLIGDGGAKAYYVEVNEALVVDMLPKKVVDNLELKYEYIDDPIYHRVVSCILAICFMLTLDYFNVTKARKRSALLELTKLMKKIAPLYNFDELFDEHLALIKNKFN